MRRWRWGSVTSVVLARSPPCSMHAYSGRSWCSDGMLRANLARLMPNGPSRRGGCGTVAKMLSNHNMPVPATVAFAALLANFLDDLPPGPPRGLAEADGAAPGASPRFFATADETEKR